MARYAKTTDEQIAQMVAYRKQGATLQQIADKLGVTKGLVSKVLNEQGVTKPRIEL